MARDVFFMTLSNALLIDMPTGPDYDDMLQALEGVQVSVFERGTTNVVTVYQRPTGATQGPTPESGASGGPNPFLTGPAGNIEFWVDGPKEIDVFVHDTILPNRVADRTFGWNATAVGPASQPTNMLAADAGIGLGSLSPAVIRQMHQIGEVIDWWRPDVSVPVPAGFEICDGRQIPAGSHDFPGLSGSAINLPDLRNRFVVGADPTKALAAGAGQGDVPTDAPGVAGTGGSNIPKNLGHGHGVPGVSHSHFTTTPDHYHAVGSLYAADHLHGLVMTTSNRGSPNGYAGGGGESVAFTNHQHTGSYAGGSGNLGIGGATGGSQHALGAWSGAPNVSLDTATNSLTWTQDPGGGGLVVDIRPRFYGLLKLMKVRRS